MGAASEGNLELDQNKCPSCGAVASNLSNCEFCGSFLVRFKNSPEDKYSLAEAYAARSHHEYREVRKLVQQIVEKQNLNSSNQPLSIIDTGLKDVTINIGDNELLFKKVEAKSGIALEIFFEEKNENLRKFRASPDFWLFEQYDGYYDGTNGHVTCYRIDFGGDLDGAVRVLTEILKEVCGKTERDFIEYENFDETEAGLDSNRAYSNGEDIDEGDAPIWRKFANWIGGAFLAYFVLKIFM